MGPILDLGRHQILGKMAGCSAKGKRRKGSWPKQNPDDQEDYEQKAKWLVECAQWRRDERVALANARRRARELIAKSRVSVVKEESGAYEVLVSPKPASKEESGPSVAASK